MDTNVQSLTDGLFSGFNILKYWNIIVEYLNPLPVLFWAVIGGLAGVFLMFLFLFLLRKKILVQRCHFTLKWLSYAYFIVIPLFAGFSCGQWAALHNCENQLVKRIPKYLGDANVLYNTYLKTEIEKIVCEEILKSSGNELLDNAVNVAQTMIGSAIKDGTGNKPKNEPGSQSGSGSANESDSKSVSESGNESGNGSGSESDSKSVSESANDSGSGSANELANDSGSESESELTNELANESRNGSANESANDSGSRVNTQKTSYTDKITTYIVHSVIKSSYIRKMIVAETRNKVGKVLLMDKKLTNDFFDTEIQQLLNNGFLNTILEKHIRHLIGGLKANVLLILLIGLAIPLTEIIIAHLLIRRKHTGNESPATDNPLPGTKPQLPNTI